jgi:hypothetical protein
MHKMSKLSALLAVAAIAPAVVAPKVIPTASAQEMSKEFPDVATNHWAYAALQKLAQAGVLEGYAPHGDYLGNKPMTRYEFAVALARALQNLPQPTTAPAVDLGPLTNRVAALEARPQGISRQDLNDAIDSLRKEFGDELKTIDARLDNDEGRISALENRVVAPNPLTISVGIVHHAGTSNYISDSNIPTRPFLDGFTNPATPGFAAFPTHTGNYFASQSDEKYAYTDVEVRLQDRVTDRLSVNAALRSLGSTGEDPWVGDTGSNVYVREAYATADLSAKKIIGFSNVQATLGRQHSKIGLGLLYDNDLAPTDQVRVDSTLGPLKLTGWVGSQGNSLNGGAGGANPYSTQGAVGFLNPSPGGVNTTPGTTNVNAYGYYNPAVGFPGIKDNGGRGLTDNNESLARVGLNLFRIAGKPVSVGISDLFQGYQYQRGQSVDLTLPLFNRTIGFEIVRQESDANGQKNGHPGAGLVTVPVLRSNVLDLDFAYGKAKDGFEYYATSSANPYARTYAEAIFDRPVALGAPLINTEAAGQAQVLAAKQTFDVGGTLRLPYSFLRKLPINVRYYHADSAKIGGVRHSLGDVYTVGTKFALTPGLDIGVKGGYWNPAGDTAQNPIRYIDVSANVGF